MTAEALAVIAGTVLSLIFSYFPGLNKAFDALDATYKRLIMLGLLALTALAVFGLSCSGLGANWGIDVGCDQAGAIKLFEAFFLALVANQSAYLISPK